MENSFEWLKYLHSQGYSFFIESNFVKKSMQCFDIMTKLCKLGAVAKFGTKETSLRRKKMIHLSEEYIETFKRTQSNNNKLLKQNSSLGTLKVQNVSFRTENCLVSLET